jgi:acetyl esterase
MPLDPQAQAYLDRMAELGLPPTEELSPEQARRQAEDGAPVLFGPKEEVASVRDIEVGGVPVRVYSPEERGDLPVVVYFHGGGWVIGSLETHDGACRAIANRSGCRIASVDYRLAPEHRFPAAVDDCWTVTRWAFDQSPRVAVAGDSAGGNLAAVVTRRCRDEGLPLGYQVLVYPVTDYRFDTASYARNAVGYGLTLAGMRYFWDHYLPPREAGFGQVPGGPAGGRADGTHPDASPLRAASLAGAAPALIVVCEYDPLRDEGVAYAERLRQSGVPVHLSEYDGMIHGFLRMAAQIDRTRDVLNEVGLALREALRLD